MCVVMSCLPCTVGLNTSSSKTLWCIPAQMRQLLLLLAKLLPQLSSRLLCGCCSQHRHTPVCVSGLQGTAELQCKSCGPTTPPLHHCVVPCPIRCRVAVGLLQAVPEAVGKPLPVR